VQSSALQSSAEHSSAETDRDRDRDLTETVTETVCLGSVTFGLGRAETDRDRQRDLDAHASLRVTAHTLVLNASFSLNYSSEPKVNPTAKTLKALRVL